MRDSIAHRGEQMLPDSLARAIERIDLGEPYYVVLPEFHDNFVAIESAEARMAMLIERPRLTSNRRLDALAGALAHYLAHHHKLPVIPGWANDPARVLDQPWHTSSINIDWTREYVSDAMREYLTFASPAEFASRNIFTEERPLRRARGPQPAKT
jgi:hypothetical protein